VPLLNISNGGTNRHHGGCRQLPDAKLLWSLLGATKQMFSQFHDFFSVCAGFQHVVDVPPATLIGVLGGAVLEHWLVAWLASANPASGQTMACLEATLNATSRGF
jgi:hypothetical protein